MTSQADVDAMKAALQEKRLGRSVTKVAAGSRSIEYQALTIGELEAAIEKAEGEVLGRRPRGFIRPFFNGFRG